MTTIGNFLISNPWIWFIIGAFVLFVFIPICQWLIHRGSVEDSKFRTSVEEPKPRESYDVTTTSREWFIPKEQEAECWRLYSEWMNQEGNDCYEKYLFWRKVYDIFPDIQGCEDAEVDEEYDDIKMRITENK